jgi:uncharacterized DUF497 family protein
VVRVKRLVWDEWNIAHIAKHKVIPEEVEEICHNDALVQQGHTGRLLIFGLTKGNKMITVIIDPEPEKEVYYVVTARPSSKRERNIYRDENNKQN